MKKIATITFHASHNYGSVLQAYALQNAINREFKCKSEIINYIKPEQKDMYKMFEKNTSIKNILKNIRVLAFNYKKVKKRNEDFNKFITNKLNLTAKEYNSSGELESTKLSYDAIICGSDQIWNLRIKDFDYTYFLGFVKNVKKIAYAPSFGGSNPIKNKIDKEKIKKYLEEFTSLSVREQIGKEILNDIVDIKVDEVLDPTLLLEANEWDKIASKRLIEDDYIFFYSIDYNDDVIKMVKMISHEFNMPVVILYTTNKTYKTVFKGFILAEAQAPEDFLSLIKYAKLVLSNSFHGNVFSIIYRKPFYTLRGTYDGKINNDDRLTTLLNKLNIKNRELNIKSIDITKISCDIDYSSSEKNIDFERKKSIDYLRNAINK